MLTREYLYLLGEKGSPPYSREVSRAGEDVICMHGAPFLTLTPPMWDYDQRIADMDTAGVDMAIVSLACPNAYFGDAQSSMEAAQLVNNSMAEQQTIRPDRVSWLASLPWQYELLALQELERCMRSGAVGVMVIANISGENLTDPKFDNIWREIDKRGLPVLLHPGVPQGARDQQLDEYSLAPSVGFPADTSLAIARMILDGFFDRYPNLKLIAAHGGGSLPFLAGRLDMCHSRMIAASTRVSEKPSEYLKRIYYDAVVYDSAALNMCIEVAGSADRILFGSDYPHPIGDMAGCLQRIDELPGLTARRIRGANAQKLFGL
jgi:aminocarboxymuconate-semialdehyde decarboxylase